MTLNSLTPIIDIQKRKADDMEDGEMGDPEMMAMMGFSGFGGSAKR